MLRLIRRYGPIMTMPILSLGDVAIVSDPALVKEVFTAPTDVLLGGEGVGPAAAIYGAGSMFVQEEPEHLRRRKLLTPPLHGSALSGYVPIIEDSTRAAMACWPVDRSFEMLAAARSLMRASTPASQPRTRGCRGMRTLCPQTAARRDQRRDERNRPVDE